MKKQPVVMKVCGMREPENIMEVAALHPAYMGFIFFSGSPRFVGTDFVLPPGFPATIRKVGVFVNETTERMVQAVKKHRLDDVQLHGTESAAQCLELKNMGVGVIKVFSIGDDFNFEVLRPYHNAVDYFLFDTRGRYHGGNARTFDWSLLGRYDQAVPFFLSGGITPDNVAGIHAFPQWNLRAIDINSGVEIKPALKDADKIRAVQAILNAKQEQP